MRRRWKNATSGWNLERDKIKLRRRVSIMKISGEYTIDPEMKLLRYIGLEGPMIDIGANTGDYSAVLEDVVGAENLYLFEPLPELYKHLRKRFRKSHVFNHAVSSEDGSAVMRVPYINGKRYNTRATLNTHKEDSETGCDMIEIKLTPLDSVVNQIGLKSIGFIKVDVEGHEIGVIEGAYRTLEKFKPLILIEIEQRHHDFPLSQIFSKFESQGYQGYYLNARRYTLLPTDQFCAERDQNPEFLHTRKFSDYLNNFFFVHKTKKDEFLNKSKVFLDKERELSR